MQIHYSWTVAMTTAFVHEISINQRLFGRFRPFWPRCHGNKPKCRLLIGRYNRAKLMSSLNLQVKWRPLIGGYKRAQLISSLNPQILKNSRSFWLCPCIYNLFLASKTSLTTEILGFQTETNAQLSYKSTTLSLRADLARNSSKQSTVPQQIK